MIVDLFLKVVNLSIGAIPLMAALLLLRLLFKKAVPRKIFYIAWVLVFLRLMVPFSLESDLSFFNIVPEATVVEENLGTSVVFVENENEQVEFPVFINPDRENPNVDMPYHSAITGEIVTGPDITTVPMDKNRIYGTVWIFGTAALLLFGIIGYFAVLKKLRFESIEYTDKIRLSEFFKTPVVCGLIRPKIILPMNFDLDDEAKINSVISHECTHIRRGDNLWRLLATFTLYVHWFNPLVWICYNAFIRDMEVSCDEAVLSGAKNDIRTEYAESLVALAGNGTNPLYGGVLSFGECAVKERVKCIMNFKKTTLLIVIICIAAAAALGVIFLTNPSAPVPGEVVETENYKIDGEKVAYFYDGELSLDVIFENTGNKPLYISFNTEISYYSNALWSVWFNNENYSGGAQLVAPGEKSNFFGIIDFSGRAAGMAFDGKIFRIRREVFSDPELKESLGFAEWIFDIETYSGVVALGDFGTKFTPDQSYMPKEVVFANEEQKKYCEELISGINYEELIRFYAESFPSDETIVAEISRENAAKIIDWLKEIELVTCEPKNPNTGGGVSFYIETMDENIAISSNGGFFTISREGDSQAYAFDAESCSGEFGSMWNIAEEILAEFIVYEEGEANPQPGYVPDIGETHWIIPQSVDIRGTLFNNKEKVSVNSLFFEDLRLILKEENFNKDRIEHADMFLGDTFYPVDTVEFVRNDTGKKYVINIFENGFSLSGSAFTEEEKNAIYFAYDDTWEKFKNKIQKEFDEATEYNAYWLGLVHEKNVSEISVRHKDESEVIVPTDGCFTELIYRLRNFDVISPADRFEGNKLPSGNGNYVTMSIKFNTGTEYTVLVTETELSIVSSDMNYGLTYKLPEGSFGYDEFIDFAMEGGLQNPMTGKPVIYLYPEKETEVSVNLDFDGKLTYTYPALNDGWKVIAKPDGTLINLADNSTHYYLFWEGFARPEWTYEKGFVVKGSETENFLRENLAKMGLTPREYNDFITYWVPRMQENPYNLISFSGDEYSEIAKLTVDPKPDTMIRIHMVWKALDKPIEIEPQVLPVFERKGFVLVEWGGTEIY